MTRTDKQEMLLSISEQRAYAASFRGTSRFAVEVRYLFLCINEALAAGISPNTIARYSGITLKGV
jgi:hypothetical protein